MLWREVVRQAVGLQSAKATRLATYVENDNVRGLEVKLQPVTLVRRVHDHIGRSHVLRDLGQLVLLSALPPNQTHWAIEEMSLRLALEHNLSSPQDCQTRVAEAAISLRHRLHLT